MDSLSYLSNADPALIDNLYQQYKQDPNSVDISWRKFFEGFEFSKTNFDDPDSATAQHLQKEFKVLNLILGYRSRGHLFTQTNPVRSRRKYYPDDSLETFGLEESDLDTVFQAGSEIGLGATTLRNIVEHLKATYCESVGAEYKYIRHPKVAKWLEDKMEGSRNRMAFSKNDKKHILHKLNQAVAFEHFIHTKFTGQKRFSLEGAETLIPALDAVIEFGADLGIKEYVIGMAHRGRLNILANILNKTYEDVFFEFEGKNLFEESNIDGDVKYHLGHSSDIKTSNGKDVHMYLTPNPSHLEAVDPVVQGIVRAKIDNKYDGDENQIAPILIHGDAAIAGQGVVYEVIQMSLLKGYRTGGTVHLVINNQIGFTTDYKDARSSTYCTDVGKVTLSPVFHVNGDDVEALIYTIKLAMEYRQTFHRDVFIDILCYRKYGHNEGDEPRFTQPLLYKAIAKHDNPREIYHQKLLEEGSISEADKKAMEKEFKEMLEVSLDTAKKKSKGSGLEYKDSAWKELQFPVDKDFEQSPDTGFNKKKLKAIAEQITSLPEDIQFFKKTLRLFNARKKMIEGDGKFDWAMGELL
ncbi:MAG: 2-oxoglutarate dehydrogenase E1 component, partial [Bacteroidia bacterium]|nr:2-oxoglutarate dehydrogenase E1 component [Bacteroidia bacterium]